MVLRARADLIELGERGELRLGQALDHLRRKDRGMPLHRDPQQEADLLVEHVAAVGRWLRHRLELFAAEHVRRFPFQADHGNSSHIMKGRVQTVR